MTTDELKLRTKKFSLEIIDLAENWLNLKRLELQVNTDNASAIHLYEKFGFEKEGILRKNAFRDGIYIDAYTMAKVS